MKVPLHAALVVVALLLGANGCGSDQGSAGPTGTANRIEPLVEHVRRDISVQQVGFTQYEGTDDQYVSWAVVLNNPNRASVAVDVKLTVRFVAVDGTVLGEEVETIPVLMPGLTAWAREQPPTGLNAGSYSLLLDLKPVDGVMVDVAVRVWAGLPDSYGYRISDERFELETPSFPLETSAMVFSEFDVDQTDVPIVAVFRGSSGEIVGGARWKIETLPAGKPTAALIRSSESVGSVVEVAEVDVHVSPPSLG